MHFNPMNHSPAKSAYLHLHSLEVVSRHRDPQLRVGEYYQFCLIRDQTLEDVNV